MADGVSIEVVAKAAGVHRSTVSRAFARPEAVNPATRERIMKIAESLGYSANPFAQALRTKSSTLVPLVVPDVTNPFFAELARATAWAARAKGYSVVLCDAGGIAGEEEKYLALMQSLYAPFGVIMPIGTIGAALLQRSPLARKVVVLDRVTADVEVPTVSVDARFGIALAFDHLNDLGHRRIAYLSSSAQTMRAQDRLAAYLSVCAARGAAELVLDGGFDLEHGSGAAGQFVALAERPTAVIAGNDVAAFGFMSALAGHGIRVPADLSVVGFDGLGIGATFNPALTSVAQPIAEIGRVAIELGERWVSSGERADVVLRPSLLIRHSTAAPPGTQP